MVSEFRLTGIWDNAIRIVPNGSTLFTKPCFAVQADLASAPGALEPDFRRFTTDWGNWLYNQLFGANKTNVRIPTETQQDISMFQDMSAK